ncbi:MAG TPA: PLP-dependent aminotransferase family protein [Vicinamibacterales bacterium]|jgi:2-aminoadipate transaminase|nr:PLP-dependent aminotransferase family protein [Vicinamibacterales bacterium]
MTAYDAFLSPLGRNLHESVLRRMGQVIASRGGDLISFAAGYPDPTGFPWDDFRAIAGELLSGTDGSVLQYGPTRGYRPLLESILGVLDARGIEADLSQVMTTSGSQQGLDLTARVLIAPGDVVLVEVPTYTGAIAAFRNAQCRLVGVRQEADGIDVEELDVVCLRERAAGSRVNLLYLVPNFQNPAGILLGRAKRARLLEWAERRNVLIVEDDPYGDLYFEDVARAEDTRPLKADDRDGRVIYLSTFSKTLAPGFRVAWVAAPAPIVERFDTAKQSMDLMCGILDQRVVQESIVRGVLARQAAPLRALYRMRRDIMEQTLREQFGGRLTWIQPRGGFFLWAKLPDGYECETLLAKALEQGVIFVIGSAFCVDGSGHDRVRLSFSWPTPENIREGARRLAAAMQRDTVSKP